MYTIGELATLLKVDRNTVKCCIDRYGLTYKVKITRFSRKFHYIDSEVFWKWAKENKEKVDFQKIERNSIPLEPEWVREERLNPKFRKR